ncbi:MAG: hypothetical protein EXS13_13725 [Planctomycetes bacterium]|nr:hypothetical protein [Planctomycetota bacterium]
MLAHPAHATALQAQWTFAMSMGLASALTLSRLAPVGKAQDCSSGSIGQIALDEASETIYLGVEGGLYPGGLNDCPQEHLAAGRRLAKKIVPRASDGTPAADGVIGALAIGNSFARGVFDQFIVQAEGDQALAPAVRFVNGALQYQNLDVIRDPAADYWTTTIPDRLLAAGITAEQVQVAWIMNGVDEQSESFPAHATTTAGYWIDVLHILHDTFPNLRQCYLSSVHWLGFAARAPANEPYYFEQGFAVREVIERQLAGDPELAWDREYGATKSAWIAWGPYFWTDGLEPRKDGLQLVCGDYRNDGAHLSDAGDKKLATRLRQFWKSDHACTRRSVVPGTAPAEQPAAVNRVGIGTSGATGEPRVCGNALPTGPYPALYRVLVRDGEPHGAGMLLLGNALSPGGGVPFGGGTLYVDFFRIDPLTLDKFGNAVVTFDLIPNDPAFWNARYYCQFVALDDSGPDGKHVLSAAIDLRLGD